MLGKPSTMIPGFVRAPAPTFFSFIDTPPFAAHVDVGEAAGHAVEADGEK